ncbi:MAG TPA: hypothetical protein V6C81_07530 [Planktothrix sp.]
MKCRCAAGQSIVEYAIGIGCVTAVCLLLLGGLNHPSTDVVHHVLVNVPQFGDRQSDNPVRFSYDRQMTASVPRHLQ